MCNKSDRTNIRVASLEPKPATEEVTVNSRPPLRSGECWLLDAPGITGMGSKTTNIFQKHVENGGRIIHRVRYDDDGTLIFLDE